MKNNQVAGLVKKLNAIPGCKAIKYHGSAFSKAGTPDIIACYLGRAFLFECKQEGEAPTAIQAIEIERWKAAGAIVAVVYSADEALGLILSSGISLASKS